MAIAISIIIVNWNTRDLSAGCLNSVTVDRLQVASPDPATCSLQPANPEAIVIDNASSDGSVTTLKERFPWVQLIENSANVGFAKANNQGYPSKFG
jgi:GT2 family glycosyltransferase